MKDNEVKEEYKENGKYYTYKRTEKEKFNGEVEKSPTSISYKKGVAVNFHYSTSEPKIVIPALIGMSLLTIIIGVVLILVSHNDKGVMGIGILFIAFAIFFVIYNFKKYGKEWMEDLKKNK